MSRVASIASSVSGMDVPPSEGKKVYVTLLTKNSYLPGTLVLNESLKLVGSKYPLVIMSTPNLPSETKEALVRQGLEVITVDLLRPDPNTPNLSHLEERFADVRTKLRYAGFPCSFVWWQDSPDTGHSVW